jgi:hypothetical protein
LFLTTATQPPAELANVGRSFLIEQGQIRGVY